MLHSVGRAAAIGLVAATFTAPRAAAQVTPELPTVNGRVSAITFFEMGPDFPALEDRHFSKEFDVASARFISTQLELEMPAPGRVVQIPIVCTYFRPDGSEMGSADLSFEIQPDWTRPYNAQGRGWADAGNWTVGTYRVRCLNDGRVVAEDTFEIVNKPPTIPSIGGKLMQLRFYASSEGTVAREQRQYTSSFPASTAYINMELQLDHEPIGRTAEVPIACPVVRQDGTLAATYRISFEIQGDWRDTFGSTGWGTAAGGWWRPGVYRVYCVAEGNLIGEGWFRVEG